MIGSGRRRYVGGREMSSSAVVVVVIDGLEVVGGGSEDRWCVDVSDLRLSSWFDVDFVAKLCKSSSAKLRKCFCANNLLGICCMI